MKIEQLEFLLDRNMRSHEGAIENKLDVIAIALIEILREMQQEGKQS